MPSTRAGARHPLYCLRCCGDLSLKDPLSVCHKTARAGHQALGARRARCPRASRSVGMADRHHERLNGIFNAMDADKSGEVTPLEFIDHMLGTQMEHETVSALFRKMDTDGNGSISRAEFLAGFDRLMAEWAQPGPAVGSQEEAAAAAATFAAVDADNSGKLNLEELLSARAAAGDVADRAEVEALFKRLDVNGDGDPNPNPNPNPNLTPHPNPTP